MMEFEEISIDIFADQNTSQIYIFSRNNPPRTLEGERTTILTFLGRKEWRNVLEDRDLKDHCLLSLGLNIRLFITLNGFTKPNVNRNVFLVPFLNQISIRSPLTPRTSPAEPSAAL